MRLCSAICCYFLFSFQSVVMFGCRLSFPIRLSVRSLAVCPLFEIIEPLFAPRFAGPNLAGSERLPTFSEPDMYYSSLLAETETETETVGRIMELV